MFKRWLIIFLVLNCKGRLARGQSSCCHVVYLWERLVNDFRYFRSFIPSLYASVSITRTLFYSSRSTNTIRFLNSFMRRIHFISNGFVLLFMNTRICLGTRHVRVRVPNLQFTNVELRYIGPFFCTIPIILIVMMRYIRVNNCNIMSIVLLRNNFLTRRAQRNSAPKDRLLCLYRSLRRFRADQIVQG